MASVERKLVAKFIFDSKDVTKGANQVIKGLTNIDAKAKQLNSSLGGNLPAGAQRFLSAATGAVSKVTSSMQGLVKQFPTLSLWLKDRLPGGIKSAFSTIGSAMVAPFKIATKAITGTVSTITTVVGKAAGAAVNAISTVSAAGAGALAAVGTYAIKQGVAFNIMSQKAQGALKVLLGSKEAAGELLDAVIELNMTSPYSRASYIEATQHMIAFGFAAKEVVPTLSAVQDAVAAFGGDDQAFSEIVRVLSKVRSTGKFTAIDLNQLGIRGINAAELLAKGFGTTAASIRESMAAGTLDGKKALDTLVEQMGITYKGAAAELKKTWEGAKNRVTSSLTQLGSMLSNPFISKEGGGYVVEWANSVANIINTIRGKLGDGTFEKAFEGWARLLDRINPALEKINQKLQDADKGFLKDLGESLPMLAAVAAAFAAIGTKGIAAMLGPLGKMLPTINPILAAFAAMVAFSPELQDSLGVVFTDIGKALKPLGREFKQLMLNLAPVVTEMTQSLGSTLVQLIRTLLPPFVELSKAIAPLIQDIALLIAKVARDMIPVFQKLSPILVSIAKKFGDFFAKAIEKLSPAILKLLDASLPLVDILGDLAIQVLDALLPPLVDLIPILADIAKLFVESLGKALKVIAPAFGKLIEAVAPLLPDLAELGLTLLEALLPAFVSLIEAITPILPLIGELVRLAIKLITPFVELGGEVIADVVEAFIPLIESFTDIAEEMTPVIDKLIDDLEPVFEELKPLIPVIAEALTSQLAVGFKILAGAITAPIQMAESFGTTLGKFKAWADRVGENMGRIHTSIATNIQTAVTNGATKFNQFKTNVSTTFDGIKTTVISKMQQLGISLPGVLSTVKTVLITPFTTAVQRIQQLFSGIPTFIAKVFSGVTGAIKGPLNGIFDFINRFLITPLQKVTKPFGLNIPSLPKLHDGGFVPGQGEQAYLLKGQEAVFNPKATRAIGGKRAVDAINRAALNGTLGAGGGLDFLKPILGSVGEWLQKGAEFALGKIFTPVINAMNSQAKQDIPDRLIIGIVKKLSGTASTWGKNEDSKKASEGPVVSGNIGSGPWVKPLGNYSIGVPWMGYRNHTGQDFPASTGTPVHAVSTGVVSKVARLTTSYGQHIQIAHNDASSLYAHMSAILTAVGKNVKAGDVIGKVGSTGNSTGPHLHFEIRRPGPINPMPWMRAKGVKFDSGGILPPGLTLTYNGTGKPETIRTHEQEKALQANQGVEVNIYMDGELIAHVAKSEVDRAIQKQGRRISLGVS